MNPTLTHLTDALRRRDTNAVNNILIDHPAIVHATILPAHKTPLMIASMYNHYDGAVSLLELDACVHDTDDYWQNSLHHAATHGHIAIVKLLLDHGIAINSVMHDQWTAIMLAVKHNHIATTKYLLEHGAKCDIANKHGWTAPMLASHLQLPRICALFDELQHKQTG